jgi:hypothetical protein
MGTAVRPAKTSPASCDAFADVEAFVDEVSAELKAMAKDGSCDSAWKIAPVLECAPAGGQNQASILTVWRAC